VSAHYLPFILNSLKIIVYCNCVAAASIIVVEAE
jgi:hypothetical protein